MRRTANCFVTLTLAVLIAVVAGGAPAAGQGAASLPTLYLIGDSTVNNHTAGQVGWGDPITAFFDPAKIRVVNRARGGRSSRTFLTEGLWAQVAGELKPGDFVLMQFGHNDGGPIANAAKGSAKASLKGNGEETQEVTDDKSGQKETVHTYGWYLRKYIAETRVKGATAIVLSPVPRNIWKDSDETVARASGDYGKWAKEAATAGGAFFVDLNELVARHYEAVGAQQVRTVYFGSTDHTHTTAAGARVNAASVVEGLKSLKDCALSGFLSAAGEAAAKDPVQGK